MSQENERPRPGDLPSPDGASGPDNRAYAGPSAGDLGAEYDRLCNEVKRLDRELEASPEDESLRAQRVAAERQMHRAAAEYMDAVDGVLTKEEVLRMIREEKWCTIDDILEDLEREARGQ
jgi:hypothetical protein